MNDVAAIPKTSKSKRMSLKRPFVRLNILSRFRRGRLTMIAILMLWAFLPILLLDHLPASALDAVKEKTSQGEDGKDGDLHNYAVYAEGEDGDAGKNGSAVNLSITGGISGVSEEIGVYGESLGGSGGNGGFSVAGALSTAGSKGSASIDVSVGGKGSSAAMAAR